MSRSLYNLCLNRCADISVICERILDDLGVVSDGILTADGIVRKRGHSSAFCVCAAERDDCIWGNKV